MNVNYAKLAHKLSRYNKIVFYGTGKIAQRLYVELQPRGIGVSFCVVSHRDDNNCYFYNSIEVYQIDECIDKLQRKDTAIIIAVSDQYAEEIEKTLSEKNIDHYILLADFYRNDLFNEYKNKTVEACIEDITEWYIYAEHKMWIEFDEIRKKIEDAAYNTKRIKNKIMIALGALTPRVIKMVSSLHSFGKEILILIYPGAAIQKICENEMHELGIPCIECGSIEELMYTVIIEHAEIVHAFSGRYNTVIPYAMIKMQEILPDIVYDEYDIINEFYYNLPQDWLEEERYCLENASGVCNRGYELEYLSQQCGYHFRGKTIHFLDYCRDEMIEFITKIDEEELSLCYAGDFITESEDPNCSHACFLQFAKQCEENKCHFHVYPVSWDAIRCREYINLDCHSKYFHFHKPVSHEILMQELRKYDYGIQPIKSIFRTNEISGIYVKEKYIYCTTNHFFDYLDAGLPIIAATPVKMVEELEKEGVVLNWTIEEYDFEYLRQVKKAMGERVSAVKEKYKISNNINRLIEFYESL